VKDEQKFRMVSDLIKEVDYDIWKEIFQEGYADEDEQKETREALLDIVTKYDSC